MRYKVGSLVALVASTALCLCLVVLPRREAADESACSQNLKAIGLALNAYHAAYGCFPPAWVADGRGRPIHSWRVLILPFAGEHVLYRAYRLDEPWDGPNNRRLVPERPRLFSCPAHEGGACTAYLAVTGEGTGFPGGRSSAVAEFTDGLNSSVLVAEVSGDGSVPWTEPRDLQLDGMSLVVDDPRRPCVGSAHRRGPAVLRADGSVRRLGRGIPPDLLRPMFTISGGEVSGIDDMPDGWVDPRWEPGG